MRALPSWSITLLSVLLVTAAWIGVTSLGLVRDIFLPGPADVWSGFLELIDDGYRGRPLLLHIGHKPVSRWRWASSAGRSSARLLGLAMGYMPRLNALARAVHRVPPPAAATRLPGAADRLVRHRRDQQDHHAVPGRPAGLRGRGA